MKKMKIYGTLLACTAILTLVSCSKKSPGPVTTASVMFVNGCTNAANVSFTANNIAVSSATSLAFLRNSGYQPVSESTSSIACAIPGQAGSISATTSFTAGSNYSVFFAGNVGIGATQNLVVSTDDLTAPTSGYAKIRFVNLSSDTLSEKFFVGSNSAIDSNVTYQTVTSFSQITAGTYSIVTSDPTHPISSVPTLNQQVLVAGKIYTYILTGTNAGGTNTLALTMIQNN